MSWKNNNFSSLNPLKPFLAIFWADKTQKTILHFSGVEIFWKVPFQSQNQLKLWISNIKWKLSPIINPVHILLRLGSNKRGARIAWHWWLWRYSWIAFYTNKFLERGGWEYEVLFQATGKFKLVLIFQYFYSFE